ncbi:MAG TPA: IS256 family transposase [Verrucomicrobiae bacterium]|nr:IS256 family transposase [Verrucomicrobiae bacterium]
MVITDEVLNELLKDYQKPEDLLGKDGLLKQLQKRLLEKAMGAELTVHLGYDKHDPAGKNSGNSRNGTTPKTLKGEFGNLELLSPRDRNGSFEPQIVAKGQRRFEGIDQAIISLYSRGLTTREIEGHLLEIYGVEVSPTLVSQVTDAVCADVQVWQNRPLEEVYPIVYFDALWGKVRDNGQVAKLAVYLALGITMAGQKEVLGMWAANTEGAKFWLHVLTELKNRGMRDIFIGCVDGLKGFPEAMEAVFPATQVQLCLVHMVRHSLNYVGWKERKAVATDLKAIYRAATVAEAEQALGVFEQKWDRKYPSISKSWRTHWPELITFLKYPAEIRKAIYTTNAIESLNRSLRKISKNRGVFPNQESLLKLYYLALERIAKKWTMPIHNWGEALNRFIIEFGDRVPPLD